MKFMKSRHNLIKNVTALRLETNRRDLIVKLDEFKRGK